MLKEKVLTVLLQHQQYLDEQATMLQAQLEQPNKHFKPLPKPTNFTKDDPHIKKDFCLLPDNHCI